MVNLSLRGFDGRASLRLFKFPFKKKSFVKRYAKAFIFQSLDLWNFSSLSMS